MWPGQSTSDLGLLIVSGRKPHRFPIPGAQRCVIEAFDIDRDAGLAAVLIVTLPSRGPATETQEMYEHDPSHGWLSSGGGGSSVAGRALARARPGVSRSGPAAVLSFNGSSGGRSYLERLRLKESGSRPEQMATVNWVNAGVVVASVEVDHLLVADRRIEVPDHGRCVIVWRSAAPMGFVRPPRPRLAAVDRNGRILTELGPHDVLDTFTRAFLDELA